MSFFCFIIYVATSSGLLIVKIDFILQMPITRNMFSSSELLQNTNKITHTTDGRNVIGDHQRIKSKSPDDLSILYVMLIHNNPEFAIRIIKSLNEFQHTFIVHVDASAEKQVYEKLNHHFNSSLLGTNNVHLLENSERVHITWGGFSIVNATLLCMNYALLHAIKFDFVIDISGTTYPIKSNQFIRKTLASNLNTIFMDVLLEPNRPESHMFNHFVECDGALHRIARLPIIKGINMHIGSQWFALPKHVAQWILTDRLPKEYIEYAKNVIIADENYFATMFMNSPFCAKATNKNLLFVLFDKWENERNRSHRDNKKCLGIDPDHCGRSPTTLTIEYKYLIEASRSLFARKFDPNNSGSMDLIKHIDFMRGGGHHQILSASIAKTTIIQQQQQARRTEDWDNNGGNKEPKEMMIKVLLHKDKDENYFNDNASSPNSAVDEEKKRKKGGLSSSNEFYLNNTAQQIHY